MDYKHVFLSGHTLLLKLKAELPKGILRIIQYVHSESLVLIVFFYNHS